MSDGVEAPSAGPLMEEREVGGRVPAARARARVPSPPPAVVVGCGVTALGVLRSLARARIAAYYLPEKEGIACRSRWARPLPGAAAVLPRHAPLGTALEAADIDAGVLIACSDSAARRIATLPTGLHDRFRSTVAPPDVLETFVDKRRFAEFLRRHGLPHPATFEIECEADLDLVDDGLFECAFLKPRDSQRFFSRYGVKACRVRDRDHAESLLRTFRSEGHAVVLQEYVPGPPSSHVFLDGFVDREGRLTHLLARRRTRMYPEDFGNSTICETVSLGSVQPAIDDLRRVLSLASYRGIFSAELKQDARDGTFRFLEVNARAWWYVGFAGQCGVNVCAAAYHDALGLDVIGAEEPPPGIRLVYPSQDFAAFRAERQRRGGTPAGTSTGEWFGAWIGAKQPVWAFDDPGPAIWAFRQWLPGSLRKLAEG